MTLPGLDALVERYREQRENGVSESVARKNFHSALLREHGARKVLGMRPEIESRLEKVERALEESEGGPDFDGAA